MQQERNTDIRVAKFGGTSLADASCFRRVADIILADPRRRVIVCSAPGKRFAGDSKLTDLLAALAGRAEDREGSELLDVIDERLRTLAQELDLPPVHADLLKLAAAGTAAAQLLPQGEIVSARLLAALLCRRGRSARMLDAGDAGLRIEQDGAGAHLTEASFPHIRETLRPLLAQGLTLVIPGFYGRDAQGQLAALARGGSDITASWLAAALGLACENWTDSNGVYTADPHRDPQARQIPFLTYGEMEEMARGGAQILHPESVEPLARRALPLFIRNTLDPAAAGTEIAGEEASGACEAGPG